MSDRLWTFSPLILPIALNSEVPVVLLTKEQKILLYICLETWLGLYITSVNKNSYFVRVCVHLCVCVYVCMGRGRGGISDRDRRANFLCSKLS